MKIIGCDLHVRLRQIRARTAVSELASVEVCQLLRRAECCESLERIVIPNEVRDLQLLRAGELQIPRAFSLSATNGSE